MVACRCRGATKVAGIPRPVNARDLQRLSACIAAAPFLQISASQTLMGSCPNPSWTRASLEARGRPADGDTAPAGGSRFQEATNEDLLQLPRYHSRPVELSSLRHQLLRRL